MSAQQLHTSLLRAPVAQILRATGFHSTKPSVLDALVDMTERYLLLLATTTAAHAYSNHNSPSPTVTDVRMALTDCGILTPILGGAEEEWKERMRRSYESYDELPYGQVRRDKEMKRRDEEDTRDVREFVNWAMGDRNKEIRRVAGLVPEPAVGVSSEMMAVPEDYLTSLKKKHARTGQEERWAGTILGRQGEDRDIRIEGGPVESLKDWAARLIESDTGKATEDGLKGKDAEMEDAPP